SRLRSAAAGGREAAAETGMEGDLLEAQARSLATLGWGTEQGSESRLRQPSCRSAIVARAGAKSRQWDLSAALHRQRRRHRQGRQDLDVVRQEWALSLVEELKNTQNSPVAALHRQGEQIPRLVPSPAIDLGVEASVGIGIVDIHPVAGG